MIVGALVLSLFLEPQQSGRIPAVTEVDGQTAVAILSQVYENWNVNCSIPGIRTFRIAFDIRIAADGSLAGQPVPVRPENTPEFRAAADSASRALLASAPFDVPEGYQGGAYRPTFMPGRVCAEADED